MFISKHCCACRYYIFDREFYKASDLPHTLTLPAYFTPRVSKLYICVDVARFIDKIQVSKRV